MAPFAGAFVVRYSRSTMTDPLERLRAAKRIGFLFSGGSARCVFQIGIVETLLDLGVTPSACLGVSGGAWNAAAVAVGNHRLLRGYWRFFCRMPHIDLTNLLRERSPFIWTRLHQRAFRRYVGLERLRDPRTAPLYVAVTRLRDRAPVIFEVNQAPDPLKILLASNYLPPFYTHAPVIDGERYGDGGFANNSPYEALFERGCDAVVLMASKGESEGGIYRSAADYDHTIPAAFHDRTIVIRPRHRLPIAFVERRWEKLAPFADLGTLRAREVLLGERHPETEVAAAGTSFSMRVMKVREMLRRGTRRRAS
jgi:predicted acylesterase/phospholipase RssA